MKGCSNIIVKSDDASFKWIKMVATVGEEGKSEGETTLFMGWTKSKTPKSLTVIEK